MTFKYKVKRPDGTFTKLFNTASEAVLEASTYVDIPWREGCEAVANLDNELTWIKVFKDKNTGQMCGVSREKVEEGITYQLSVEFRDELDRNRAEAILRLLFECTIYCTDKGKLGDLLTAEENRK